MFELDIAKQSITIEGVTYLPQDFSVHHRVDLEIKSEFHKELFDFLRQWFSDSETMDVKTSGSTGTPKVMSVEKARMMQSAKLTCSFLNLKKGYKALLCMPLQYIAGKMMVVRSLVCGIDLYLIQPSGNPLKNTNLFFDFAALVPLQVFNSLQEPIELVRLKKIKNLIIGGGAIDPVMENSLKDFPNNVYSTYGMTETLSHIALRKLNGKEASDNYFLLDSVHISLSDERTMIIDAPLVSHEILYTNDIVEVNNDGSFKILGRRDNVINTGGIKVQIEEVERAIKQFIDVPFAISSLPEPKFGEIIVLVSDQEIDLSLIQDLTPSYYIPKKSIVVQKLPLTETSKIDRPALKKMISTLWNCNFF